MNGSDGVDEEHLSKMHYLDCVWKEIFRFTPVTTGVQRCVMQDTTLMGYPLRAGDEVGISGRAVSRDPRLWKVDPLLFFPERFLEPSLLPPRTLRQLISLTEAEFAVAAAEAGGGVAAPDTRTCAVRALRLSDGRVPSRVEECFGLDREHHPYAFLPFGGGHRACLGQDLARMESKAIVASFMNCLSFLDAPGNEGGVAQKLTQFPKKQTVCIQFDE